MERITYGAGYHPDMPLEHYFADPAQSDHGSLNSSCIPVLRKKSPLHFATLSPVLSERYGLTPSDKTDNAASRRGNVVHRMALGKGTEYEVGDYPDFRTKEAKEWKADLEQRNMVALLLKDVPEATKQADLLRAHLNELFMGQEWFPEVALLWTEDTPWGVVWCRALVDAWCPKLVHGADLKSSTDASDENATKQMERMGYDVQGAWYKRGLTRALDLGPGHVQFSTLFGETKPPHASQAFQLPESWHNSAWNECELALRTFAQCQAADQFPGYPRRARQLTTPPWLMSRRLERELQVDDLNNDAGLLDPSNLPPPDYDDDVED
jgi:hypothetical protein